MNLIGLMVVRNESWVLRASIAAALQWCDGLVVFVHASTDGTIDMVRQLRREHNALVAVEQSDAPEWDEATYRGIALETGRRLGGTHFAIIDGDEIMTAPGIAAIRDEAEQLAPGELLRLPLLSCWRSLDQYRSDNSPFGHARTSVVFADAPHLSYSPDADGYQLHLRPPRGVRQREAWDRDGGKAVLHLQHAVWARVEAKQRLYEETERRRWGKVRANYRAATDERGLETRPIPDGWWPVSKELIDLGVEPWQAQAASR